MIFTIAFAYFFGCLSFSFTLSFSLFLVGSLAPYLSISLHRCLVSSLFLQIWNIWRKFKFSSYELYIFGISLKRTPYIPTHSFPHFQVNFECFNRHRERERERCYMCAEWMLKGACNGSGERCRRKVLTSTARRRQTTSKKKEREEERESTEN